MQILREGIECKQKNKIHNKIMQLTLTLTVKITLNVNPFSANPTKWSNTPTKTIRRQIVFYFFVG